MPQRMHRMRRKQGSKYYIRLKNRCNCKLDANQRELIQVHTEGEFMSTKFKFSRFIAGALAALMVVTSLPETALVANAEPASNAGKIAFNFVYQDADGDTLTAGDPTYTKETITAGDGSDGYNYTEDNSVTSENFASKLADGLYIADGDGHSAVASDATFDNGATYYTRAVAASSDYVITVSSSSPQLPNIEHYTAPPNWVATADSENGVTWDASTGKITVDKYKAAEAYATGITVTLTATYTAETYTVTFALDSGTADPSSAVEAQTVTYNEYATEPDVTITKSNKVFAGWYDSTQGASFKTDKSENTATPFNFAETPITGNITLTAKYYDTVKVTFDGNGGKLTKAGEETEDVTTRDVTIAKGDTVAAPGGTNTKEGYEFDKWCTRTDSSPYTYTAFDFNTTISEDKTLYATWTAGKQKVTFKLPETNNYEKIEYAEEISIGKPDWKEVPKDTNNGVTEITTEKNLFVRVTPKTGYMLDTTKTGVAAPFAKGESETATIAQVTSSTSATEFKTYTAGAPITTVATDNSTSQVYKVSGMNGTAVTLTFEEATPIIREVTLATNSDVSGTGAAGGTANKYKVSIDGAAATEYSAAFDLQNGKTATIQFNGNVGCSYQIATKSGNVTIGVPENATDKSTIPYIVNGVDDEFTVLFTISGILANDTVTIVETSTEASGEVVLVAAGTSTTGQTDLDTVKISKDNTNWLAYDETNHVKVKYGTTEASREKLYVKFYGTNGYTYKISTNGTAKITDKDGNVLTADDEISLETATEDRETVYIGSFIVTDVCDTTQNVTITPVAATGKTVTVSAAEGDGKATSIQYSADDVIAHFVDGTSFKADKSDIKFVRFIAQKDYIYTVTVSDENAKVSANVAPGGSDTTFKNSAIITSTKSVTFTAGAQNTGDGGETWYGEFRITDVSNDVTVTITPSKGYVVNIVADDDDHTVIMTTTLRASDVTGSSKTLADVITAKATAGEKLSVPIVEGKYFDDTYWNLATGKRTSPAAANTFTLDEAGLSGAETNFVVHYDDVTYKIYYFDEQKTKPDSSTGKTIKDYATSGAIGTKAAYADTTYDSKTTKNYSGKGTVTGVQEADITSAIEAIEAGSGKTFANEWKIVQAVYYDADGDLVDKESKKDGTKTKYVEIGTIANDELLPNTLSTTKDGEVYLIPVYEDTEYTINFSMGTGTVSSNTNIEKKGSMSSIKKKASTLTDKIVASEYSAVGYIVNNWTTNANNTDVASPYVIGTATYKDVFDAAVSAGTTKYPSSITLYPVWEVEKYTINYHLNGGKFQDTSFDPVATPHQFDITSNDAARTLKDITIEGEYELDGWYYDSAFKKEVTSGIIPADTRTSVDVYAKWKAGTITITYHSNYTGSTEEDKTQEVKTNAEVTLNKVPFSKNEGYEFAGWTQAEADGTIGKVVQYVDQEKVQLEASIDLYAVWAKAGEEYTVTLDYNGGTPSDDLKKNWGEAATGSAKYKYGESTLTLPSGEDVTRDNYTLGGWELKSGEAVTSLADIKADVTLYAAWEGKTFKVTYDKNAGQITNSKISGKMNPVTVTYGETWAPLDCAYTVPGYTFAGWAESATATTGTMAAPAIWNGDKDITLYAVWAKNTRTLKLYTPYGDIDTTEYKLGSDAYTKSGQSYEFEYTYADVTGKKVKLPTAAQMEPDDNGLKFAGWYKAKADAFGNYTTVPGGKKVTTVTLTSDDDIIYVAKWTGKYELTYHYGTEEVTESRKMGANKALKANKFKEKDSFFVGWALEENGDVVLANKAKVSNTTLDNLLGSEPELLTYDLYAVFEAKLTDYDLTIVDEYGNVLESTTFKYAKGVTAKNLKKLGKSISDNFGYFVDANNTSVKVSSIKKKTPGNKTLQLVEKVPVVKTTLVFNKNADTLGGVKVKGSVSKKTVKSTADVTPAKVNGFKAAGYTLYAYSDTAGDTYVTHVGTWYYIAANGKMYLNTQGATNYHDGAHITDANVGGKTTLYAVWKSDSLDDTYTYYYDMGVLAAKIADNGMAATNYAYTTTPDETTGTAIYTQTWTQGSKVYSLATPTRPGYTFAGWKEQNAEGTLVKTTAATTSASVRYLVADWTPIQ